MKFQPIVYLPPYEYEYLPSFLFSINKHIPHLAILYKCPKKGLVDRAERGTMNETWREEDEDKWRIGEFRSLRSFDLFRRFIQNGSVDVDVDCGCGISVESVLHAFGNMSYEVNL